MTEFFISDHHFGHANILKHCAETRPFRSIDAMDEAYAERWNATVGPNDTVWYIGDFAMSFPAVERIAPSLNGVKHLIVGNHDTCYKMRPQQIDRYVANGFASVARETVLERGGLRMLLCHFQYRTPESAVSSDLRLAARQTKYAAAQAVAGEHGEDFLVHGHVHQYWRARVGAHARPELNMSVDVWDGFPVSLDRLIALYHQAAEHPQPGQLKHSDTWIPLHVEDGAGD